MGQILTLDNIISIIKIKSSDDMAMAIYPIEYCEKQKYHPDKIFYNPEYMMKYILNEELVEEPIYLEDSYGIILNVV